MATLLLAAAGSALGGTLGGVGAIVGQAVGGIAGALIDQALFASGRAIAGSRLSDLDVQASSEGEPIPRVYGRVRISGQVIWATRYEEVATEQTRGGKGGGSSVTSYHYFANFAVGLCEGPIHRISRVWANGTLLDLEKVACRIHLGGEDQEPDPLIHAREAADVPAYRGTAIVVFERLPLDDWGNRIPQLAFEVIRVVDGLEAKVRAVAMIPGSTEFGYHPAAVTRDSAGAAAAENRHVTTAASDFLAALDELIELCPNLRRISLVVAWFGDDLRVGSCRLRPGVDVAVKTTRPISWSVAGLARGEARLVARVAGAAAYGGTPADATVIAAIRAIRARGLAVTLYPFVAMDIAAGNGLADPWGGSEQAAFPWRGRITCDPAPGRPGTVDRTAAARDQIAAFVGTVPVWAFGVSGERVVCTSPGEWSFRRMILHMAHLARAAGGVDAFLIGSEFVSLTTVRDATGAYPFVEALTALAADVRAVLGASTALTYGADWSEWFGHHPADGSGDVIFHLDPLWASANIDAVGIDAWFALTDWRPDANPDAALADAATDRAYLDARIAGGEGFDWWYASDAARRDARRSPIVDGAHGEHWVFRPKDLVGWWSNPHHDRPGGVRSARPTAWVPGSKPIWFTETGCPAVDLAANRPSAFPDPKSSEARLPWFSSGARDDFAQRRTLEAILDRFDPARADGANPLSPSGVRMLDRGHAYLWAWDARPYPAFPSRIDVWSDGPAWATGHWLNGRLGGASLEGLIRAVLADVGFAAVEMRAVEGHLDGFVIERRMSTRDALEPLIAAFGIDAVDTGTALRFLGRSRRHDAALGLDDLVDDDRGRRIEIRRKQESELPCEVSLTFSDATLDHRRTTVSATRRLGGSHRRSSADIAAVLPIETAVRLAEAWLADLWSGRTTYAFRVAPTRLDLEPGDLVALDLGGRTDTVMITATTDGAHRALEARALDPAAARAVRAGRRVHVGARTTVAGRPIAHVLDLVHTSEDAGLHRPWLAAWASPWTGPLAVRRVLDGSTVLWGTIDRPAVIGVTTTALRRGPLAVWDRCSTLEVRLWGGSLASVSERAVLDGANRAAVRSDAGLWEVLQFTRAELIAAATWRLSGFLRGQGGSDDALAADGLPAGAPFVLLDDRLVTLPVGLDDIGREIALRVGPAADPYTSDGWIDLVATPTARGHRPWSPTPPRVTILPATGDVAVAWTRRSRVGGADSWALLEVPLGASSELYRVEIRRAGTLVASARTTTASWTWARAARDAALGAGPADVVVTVAEIDPEWGDGVARSVAARL